MARIHVRGASVAFSARPHHHVTLKEYILKGLFRRSINPEVVIHALSNINLTVGEGERVGVIGHNGAGKTTLLKMLAGIYPPTAGTCEVEGRICSLFDIALGFENEASGRENIVYRSYLQGETPAEVRAKSEEIVAFSELGEFLDLPVKSYSAGMRMRLAFAIATAAEPEVLLIDEVLAAGDHAFQIKAKARMREMMSASRLMVVVSHDLNTVRETCTRVLWMRHGAVVMEGEPGAVVEAYTQEAQAQAKAAAKSKAA
jgi:lipopolysaccharide transport system ATP-binding protein